MARLAMTVHVTAPDGTTAVLGPDSDLPEWALRAIGNPKVWAVAPGQEPAPAASPVVEPEPPVGFLDDEPEAEVVAAEVVSVGAPETTTDGDAPAEAVDAEANEVPVADGYDYSELTVAELRHEISERNQDRETGDRIPTDGAKAALIAALEADDAKA